MNPQFQFLLLGFGLGLLMAFGLVLLWSISQVRREEELLKNLIKYLEEKENG